MKALIPLPLTPEKDKEKNIYVSIDRAMEYL